MIAAAATRLDEADRRGAIARRGSVRRPATILPDLHRGAVVSDVGGRSSQRVLAP